MGGFFGVISFYLYQKRGKATANNSWLDPPAGEAGIDTLECRMSNTEQGILKVYF
jgi:hypothetical protein